MHSLRLMHPTNTAPTSRVRSEADGDDAAQVAGFDAIAQARLGDHGLNTGLEPVGEAITALQAEDNIELASFLAGATDAGKTNPTANVKAALTDPTLPIKKSGGGYLPVTALVRDLRVGEGAGMLETQFEQPASVPAVLDQRTVGDLNGDAGAVAAAGVIGLYAGGEPDADACFDLGKAVVGVCGVHSGERDNDECEDEQVVYPSWHGVIVVICGVAGEGRDSGMAFLFAFNASLVEMGCGCETLSLQGGSSEADPRGVIRRGDNEDFQTSQSQGKRWWRGNREPVANIMTDDTACIRCA